MPSGALFGSSSALGGSSGGSKHLVEFRAGRMIQKDRMMHPDNRKGFLYIYQSDDSLMHFCWKDRTTGTVEDDLIIFPDDCEFLRVNQCTTGRVYVLKFKASCRKLFFWMQEPKSDKDEEWCRRINEVLNNPPTVSSGRSGNVAPDGDLQNILNNMSQQQLMQLFGGVGQIGGLSSLLGTMRSPPSQSSRSNSSTPIGNRPAFDPPRAPPRPPRAAPEPATPTGPTTPAVTNTSAMTTTATTTTPAATSRSLTPPTEDGSGSSANVLAGGSLPIPGESVDLSTVISSADVIAAAGTHAQGLREHLPQPPPDMPQDDLKTTILSPQFAQAMSLFSNAMSSGQLGPVISQFGLGSDAVAAAQKGDMKAFIKALECAEKKSQLEDKPKPSDKNEEDDNMSLD